MSCLSRGGPARLRTELPALARGRGFFPWLPPRQRVLQSFGAAAIFSRSHHRLPPGRRLGCRLPTPAGSFCPLAVAAGPWHLQQPWEPPLGAAPRPAHLPCCPTPALLLLSHQLLAPHPQLAVSWAATFLPVSLASHGGLPKAPDPGATCWEEAISQEQADSPAVGGDS